MSTDDYYEDEEDEDLQHLEQQAENDAGGARSAPSGRVSFADWLSNRRGWVLLVSLAVAQGLFALIMLFMQRAAKPAGDMHAESIEDLAVEMLGHEIGIKEIYQYLPGRGGKRVSIGMELVLVLGQLPEERVEGADKPTPEEIAIFIAAIQDMEPRIRSKLNSLIQGIPMEHYSSTELVRDYERIKKEIADYVNTSLDNLDFGKSVRRGIGKRRVTDVLIPVFLRQIR